MAPDGLAMITALDSAMIPAEVDECLRQSWAKLVPGLIPDPFGQFACLEFDEAVLKKALFEHVEAFIVGPEHAEKADKFQHLKNGDVPSYIYRCLKKFSHGERIYSCFDCAADPRCVMCRECIEQSSHQNHWHDSYTITNNSGFCDCGDPKLWDGDCACTSHRRPSGHVENINVHDAKERLPKDVAERLSAVVQTTLSYAYQKLMIPDGPQSPTEFLCETLTSKRPSIGGCEGGETDNKLPYVAVIYNYHLQTNARAAVWERLDYCMYRMGCMHTPSFPEACQTDSYVLKIGTLSECELFKTLVDKDLRLFTHDQSPQIRLHVMSTIAYKDQVFAMLALKWMEELAKTCGGFKAVICDASMQRSPHVKEDNIVSAFLLADVHLPRSARQAVHSLFMEIFPSFIDAEIFFSRLLARLHPQLMEAYVADDYSDEYSESCIFSLAPHFFTSSTVAHILLAEGLVHVIVHSFATMFQQYRKHQGSLSFNRSTQFPAVLRFNRILYALKIIRRLLNTVPRGDQWTEKLREGFIETFAQLLQVMEIMEGMDGHIPQTQTPIEYKDDWLRAFNLQENMQSIFNRVQQWCVTDVKVLEKCLQLSTQSSRLVPHNDIKRENREVAGSDTYRCIQCNMASQEVSIHHPTIRMLASLLVSELQQGIFMDGGRVELFLQSHARELMELPLRTLVLVSQHNAGVWQGNDVLAKQLDRYQHPKYRESMLDKDVIMMQLCAALMKPDDFMAVMLDKFPDIHLPWPDERGAVPPNTEADLELTRQVTHLSEEFLYWLIVLIGERYYPGVSKVTAKDCLKNDVIHMLCIEPKSYRDLLRGLALYGISPWQEAKSAEVDSILRAIAILRRSSGTDQDFYELMPELMNRYNPFFYHYNRDQSLTARKTQEKRKKKSKKPNVFPPPQPPPFAGVFQNIIRLLDCDAMICLLKLTVDRALSNNPRCFSEGQLIRVLYLIGYGLHEDQRTVEMSDNSDSPIATQFLEKAAIAGIFRALEDLKTQKRSKEYASLVEWVLDYYKEISTQASGEEPLSRYHRGYWENKLRSCLDRCDREEPVDNVEWLNATSSNVASKCKPGDLLEFRRLHGIYKHWAMCIGDGLVIHVRDREGQIKDTIEKGVAKVHVGRVEEIAGRDRFRVNNQTDKARKFGIGIRPIDELVSHVKRLVDESEKVPYDLAGSNCEHYVSKILPLPKVLRTSGKSSSSSKK